MSTAVWISIERSSRHHFQGLLVESTSLGIGILIVVRIPSALYFRRNFTYSSLYHRRSDPIGPFYVAYIYHSEHSHTFYSQLTL